MLDNLFATDSLNFYSGSFVQWVCILCVACENVPHGKLQEEDYTDGLMNRQIQVLKSYIVTLECFASLKPF